MNKLGLATLHDQDQSEHHRPVAYTKSDKGSVAEYLIKTHLILPVILPRLFRLIVLS